jgi:hypothetical protein
MLTNAMPPITPTITAACAGALTTGGNKLTAASARAAVTPPQASTLPSHRSVPAI